MPETSLCANSIRILDFDGSVLGQSSLLRKYTTLPYSAEIIDLKDIAPFCRYLTTKRTLERIKERLKHSLHNAITLYGSGDFHHISSILISGFSAPTGVIVFDFHPDWDGMSLGISCGSWVTQISRAKNIQKTLLLGPSSKDLSSLGLTCAYFKSLRSGKLEIFPYDKKPSRAYFRYLKTNACLKTKRDIFGSTIYWSNLKEKSADFIRELIKRMPVDDVYISIDKDCLSRTWALTNWEEGQMPIGWLLNALSVIKEEKNVVGMDITGEYSPIVIKNPLKRFISSIDHCEQTAEGVELAKITSVNEAANLKILDLFLK